MKLFTVKVQKNEDLQEEIKILEEEEVHTYVMPMQ